MSEAYFLFSLSNCFLSGPLHSQNLEAVHVSSTEIHLQWDPPQNSTSASFHYYLVTILDAETNKWEKLAVEKINTSTIIGNLKPFHQYYIYLQTVAEKGSLSCNEKTILITTGDYIFVVFSFLY